jgi:hypothetical protein
MMTAATEVTHGHRDIIAPLRHDPEMPAPDLIRGGNRLSEKIMLKQHAVLTPASRWGSR